jgi:hypothetical protein
VAGLLVHAVPMTYRCSLVVAALVAACGDSAPAALPDGAPTAPDAGPGCTDLDDPVPTGPLASVAEMPALTGCLEGGLGELDLDTWFVRRETPGEIWEQAFSYGYPRLANSCEDGLSYGTRPYTWSDGTLGFARDAFEQGDFVFAYATVMCLRADGSLLVATRQCYRVGNDGGECEEGPPLAGHRYPVLGELARNVTLVGQEATPDTALDVDVKGDVAYVVTMREVRAYDLSDPGALTLLGTVELPGEQWGNDIEVLVSGDRRTAYVSDSSTWVIDVTDPTAMVVLQAVDFDVREPYSHTVQIGLRDGVPHLYLGGEPEVLVYDLSEPQHPAYAGEIFLGDPENTTHDMTVVGTTLYVNDGFRGFVALDTTDLAAPVEVARLETAYYAHASAVGIAGGRPVVVDGGEGMEGDGRGTRLRIRDGDPASPTYLDVLGEYATRPETGMHNMLIRDGIAYIAYYQDGLRIVGLSDPTAPVEIGHYNSWNRDGGTGPFGGAIGVDLTDAGDVVLVNMDGVMRLRPALPTAR